MSFDRRAIINGHALLTPNVVHVDFAAWGASEPQQRQVCGARAYVLRGREARAAHDAALRGEALLPHVTVLSNTETKTADPTLPGMTAWLLAHRPGVANT